MNTAQEALNKFVRRPQLREGERRVNFTQIDNDILLAITSKEAVTVTHSMSQVYNSLVRAPFNLFERPGVLHLTGMVQNDRHLTAWEQLIELTNVSGATLKKALRWMHEQGIIGYFAGKNGAGIRIFFNRAKASIASVDNHHLQKNLRLIGTAKQVISTAENEAAFRSAQEYQDQEEEKSPAPKNCANHKPIEKINTVKQTLTAEEGLSTSDEISKAAGRHGGRQGNMDVIVKQLRAELGNYVREVATQAASRAAAQAAASEVGRTREWFEQRALPKAVRIAQKESYDVLRSYGLISTSGARSADVGRNTGQPSTPCDSSTDMPLRSKTEAEIRELAETCAALFQLQGKPLGTTLAELKSKGRSWLSEGDLERVGLLAHHLVKVEGASAC